MGVAAVVVSVVSLAFMVAAAASRLRPEAAAEPGAKVGMAAATLSCGHCAQNGTWGVTEHDGGPARMGP